MRSPEEKDLQVALIGYGYWGKKLYQTLANPFYKQNQIAVVDPVASATENDVHTVPFDFVLADQKITHVFIATPEETHFELVKQSLQNNKHVFVEKPLCLYESQAKILQQTATEQNKTLYVDYTFLFDPYIKKIKELIDAGEIGTLKAIYSTRHSININKPSISVYDDLATHDMYVGRLLFGSHPNSVKSTPYFSESRQIVQANCEYVFQYGTLHAQYSWIQPQAERTLKIVGTNGTILWTRENPQLMLTANANTHEILVSHSRSPLELSIQSFLENQTQSTDYLHDVALLERLRTFR